MQIISQLPGEWNDRAARISLPVDRLTLAKRRWRGAAEDGTEFGFDLPTPLPNGAVFHATTTAFYVIAQNPEPVLEIALIPRPAPVARLGWAVGNLHFPIEVTEAVIRVPDDPALRQLFEREKIPFTACERVFTPFAKGHRHDA
jgi:urease accessory protein